MMVNGKPRWTCRTHVQKVAQDGRIEVAPLRNLPVIKDLATDMTEFFDKWVRAEGRFHPTTMSLQMTNSIDGNDNNGRQARKYTGTSSATLSIDLEFDTADEGTNDKPVDVRDLTKEVAQFVLPSGKDAKAAPPQVKFEWGTFILGVPKCKGT